MRFPSAVRLQRAVVLALWGTVLLLFWLKARQVPGGAVGVLERALAAVAGSPWALLLLLALYLLRPLLLMPMTVLTVFAGFLLGVPKGMAFALAAVLMSASGAYLIARFLVGGGRPRYGASFLARLHRHSFETIVASRLMFVPGDVINYASGALKVPYRTFLAATALGGLPGMLMGILAGASLEGPFRFERLQFNPWMLLGSLLILFSSLGLSAWLRRGHAGLGGDWQGEEEKRGTSHERL